MLINIKTAITKKDKEYCLFIRKEVFVKEQRIPEKIEFDDKDVYSTYIIAKYKNKPVGTARHRFTRQGIKLERFAVLKDYRGLGVGKALLSYVINVLGRETTIYLNAQEQAVGFYRKLGFEKTGARFFEAYVPHFKMILR
tara:strand:- start:193 stop:612 length:420 start_codon:yes stop_codon:yes gene_type:complete